MWSIEFKLKVVVPTKIFFDNMGLFRQFGAIRMALTVFHDTTKLGKKPGYKRLSSSMPNKNRRRTKQFLSLERKNCRRFFKFFTLPKQMLSIDNCFLKAEKSLSNNLLETVPVNWKCYVFWFDFLYELFTSNKIYQNSTIYPNSPNLP